jgi:hypothetical protein
MRTALVLATRYTSCELEKAAFRESEAELPEDVPEDLVKAILKAREVRL